MCMSTENELSRAVSLLGGFEAVGRVCGVSGKAVQKWVARGKLPRTEATGETDYSAALAKAHPAISKKRLLATVVERRRA
jgi:hypothetical protein